MSAVFKDTARRYYDAGYVPIPINLKSATGKGPYNKGWENYSYDKMSLDTLEALIEKYPDAGVGLVMGHQVKEGWRILAIDIDDDSVLDKVKAAIGPYNCSKFGKKGETIFVRAPMSLAIGSKKLKRLGEDGKKLRKPSVEFLGLKTQTVVPPSIHPETKGPYTWLRGDLLDLDFMSLPVISEGTYLEIEAICASRDKTFVALNEMMWLGVGGGGDTHDTCVVAVASLVAMGWCDDDIHTRIERAKFEACERNGDPYNWPESTKTIQEWIDSARAKGYADKKEKAPKRKEAMERIAATWAIDFLGGKDYVATDEMGILRRYSEGFWPPVDVETLKQTVFREFREITNKECKNAVEIVHSETYRPQFGRSAGLEIHEDPKMQRACFLNGTLDLRNNEFLKHDPDDELRHQLAFEYPTEEDAQCPRFDQFMDETFGDDMEKRECVLQFMAYSLIPDNSFQKAIVLIGEGGNGKGTLVRLWCSLMDPASIGSVALNELNNERHRTSLVGCLMNVASEQTRFDAIADNYFKKITGNDGVTVRRLYKESKNNVVLSVRFVIQVNSMPSTSDSGEALRRRLMMIEFLNVPKTIDPNLDAKLRKERGAIMKKHLLPALRKLYAQGKFTEPESSRVAVAQYLKENDPVALWMDECCEKVEDLDKGTLGRELFAHFCDWLDRSRYRYPINEVTWGKKLKSLGFPSIDKWVKAHNACYKYRMLRLREAGKF